MSLLLHAHVWYQGLDMWSPSSYIHHALLGGNRTAQPLELNGQCAGLVAALQLAAEHLVADPDRRAAVVTTAERFAMPAFDRWHAEGAHINFGDGAAGVVLARGRGVARLVAARSAVDTTLELMYRGNDEFTLFSPAAQGPLNLEARKAVLEEELGMHETIAQLDRGLAEAVYGVLDEAGLTISDVARFSFPNVGLAILSGWVKMFGIDVSQTAWELGRTTGHVGAADHHRADVHARAGAAVRRRPGRAGGHRGRILLGVRARGCVEIPDWSPAG